MALLQYGNYFRHAVRPQRVLTGHLCAQANQSDTHMVRNNDNAVAGDAHSIADLCEDRRRGEIYTVPSVSKPTSVFLARVHKQQCGSLKVICSASPLLI